MAWLRNLPISRKFIYAFGIVCSLCIALGAFSFITFEDITQKSQEVGGNSFPALVHLSDLRSAILQFRREDLNILLCPTPACTAEHTAKRQKALSTYKEAAAAFEPLIRTPHENEVFQDMSESFSKYVEESDRAIGFVAAGKIWAEGVQGLTQQVASTAKASLEESVATFKALSSVKSLKEAFDLQTSYGKTVIAKTLAESNRLTDASI